jgi:hypothetical protein
MFLLTNLTEKGYLHLKSERKDIVKKIEQLQSLLDEFDLALPYLESIFQPKIKISKDINRGIYIARTSIPFSDKETLRLTVKVCSLNKYKEDSDPKLLDEAQKIMRERIKEEFPQHFKG